MKIAVIVKSDANKVPAYTTYKKKIIYHPDNLFLSVSDKSALEYALQLIELNGGSIDVYTFDGSEVGDRILRESLALGANNAVKLVVGDATDPLQQSKIASTFVSYLRKQNLNYDLLLTGKSLQSNLAAKIALQLETPYYDNVAMIDTNFNLEIKLEKGKVRGKFQLPATIAVSSSINIPRLANFIDLNVAINSKITTINFEKTVTKSKLLVDQSENKKIIFDLNKDPEAVTKLVTVLRKKGIISEE